MIVLNILGFCLLALTFFVAIKNYPKLPDRIPIHFNIEGEADRYGHRKCIFFTPVLSLIIFVSMIIIAFGDVGYNYPVEITEENIDTQKYIGDIVIGGLNAICTVLFYLVTLLMINYQNVEKRKKISIYLLSFIGLSLVFPIVMVVIAYFSK